ncbi:MAG: hypothetical protein ACRC2T_04590, partial [Thermoguttaceae bacterium]
MRTFCGKNQLLILLVTLIVLSGVSGCAAKKMAELRRVSVDPVADNLKLNYSDYKDYSTRAKLTLRTYDLERLADQNTIKALIELQKAIENQPTPDLLYTFAEIAYFEAKLKEHENPKFAAEIYFASILYSYHYLFDAQFEQDRNPYDPQFRDVCLVYNTSLQNLLKLLGDGNELALLPGETYAVESLSGNCDFSVKMTSSSWKGEEIEKFKFASDYELKGLQNEYRQYGLGVP